MNFKRPRYVISLGLLIFAAAAWSMILAVRSDNTDIGRGVVPSAVAQAVSESSQPVELSSRLLVVGDVFWGRYVQRKAETSGLGTAYITSGLDPTDRSRYDAWIGNFECPITPNDVAYSRQVASLKFNCRPEYLSELSKWFTAVTLANNHMYDNSGQAGLQLTRDSLQSAGIQYTGNNDMAVTDDICEVVSLPARSGEAQSTHIPVALCGYMYVVNVEPTSEQLAVMQKYAAVMPVIALPHMGVEYRTIAELQKQAAYRRMIDNGADAVLAAHPHVIQNSESYKGKLIAYSLGNFLFDQQSLGKDTSVGLGAELTLTVSDSAAVAVYQQLGDGCRQFKDDCLQRLEDAGFRRPAIKVSYDFRCFDIRSGVPVAGDKTLCQQANKSATTEKLGDLANRW